MADNLMSHELGLVTEMTRSHLVALVARFPNPLSSPDEFSALTDVPLFLGYMLAYFLNGILFVQVFVYFISFRRTDPRYLQIIVLVIFLVECTSTVCATEIVIYSIITQGYLSFSVILPDFQALAVLIGVASSIVHGFYCWRLKVLGGHWAIIVVIVILSVIQCVMVSLFDDNVFNDADVLGAPSAALGEGSAAAAASELAIAGSLIHEIWLITTALCDIIITCTIFYLQRRILKDLDKGSQLATRVKRLMSIAIDTGLITAAAAMLQLLLFLVFRGTLVSFCLFYSLPTLYANCALATLNARLTVPGKGFRESMPAKLVEENENSA
ncbi:hypothetical protein D9757_000913 [Collybiopsis confluens]|uniref:DUF6534 domain-containing protein n=1 Tax=Collybiopsis confluens TaxID=2823264 RepID=A0A8H5I005_9AGAR|nr:hypothetical protein D9757_000913 [Collybiopsis confluens]